MSLTGIIDVSHWEYDALGGRIGPALEQAKASGVVAVIAKATQGQNHVDPSFSAWADAVHAAGLLFGAYHFNSATAPGDVQADWFLNAVGEAVEHLLGVESTLLCLDYEPNPSTRDGTMSPADARAFLHRVHASTHRRPTLYGGSSFLANRFKRSPESDVIDEFPLWVAAYGPLVPKLPKSWSAAGFTLWQYTNGTDGNIRVGPTRTPGFGKCDRSTFAGSIDELTAYWHGA